MTSPMTSNANVGADAGGRPAAQSGHGGRPAQSQSAEDLRAQELLPRRPFCRATMNFLLALGQDVEIYDRPRKNRRAGTVSVTFG